mmetsp:Transcript_37286/g.81734  ORF Transcript_37286/g.81734 Transcript_37286/m.81734 type:complete len:251 (-) Transcript_37286:1028-1780(-)
MNHIATPSNITATNTYSSNFMCSYNERYNLHDIGKNEPIPLPSVDVDTRSHASASTEGQDQLNSAISSIFRQISSKSMDAITHHLPMLSMQDSSDSTVDNDISMSDISNLSSDPEASAEVAASLSRQGKQLLRAGQYEQSLHCFLQVLPQQREIYGTCTRHPSVAATLNNMGVAYKYMAQQYGQEYERKALSSFEEALCIFQECLGPDHPVTAKTVHNLWQLMQRISKQKAERGIYVSRDTRAILTARSA